MRKLMSLKWRIALGYSFVLIVAITAMSGIIVWRFQQILYDQAESSVNATMHAIVQFAQQATTPFSLEDSSLGTLQFLFNSSNLATWNTANSYVQVDSSEGYPLAKTANLGEFAIPPNPKSFRRARRRVPSGNDRGPFISSRRSVPQRGAQLRRHSRGRAARHLAADFRTSSGSDRDRPRHDRGGGCDLFHRAGFASHDADQRVVARDARNQLGSSCARCRDFRRTAAGARTAPTTRRNRTASHQL